MFHKKRGKLHEVCKKGIKNTDTFQKKIYALDETFFYVTMNIARARTLKTFLFCYQILLCYQQENVASSLLVLQM